MTPSIKGLLVQERQHLQSTKIINRNNNPPPSSLGDDFTPCRLPIKYAIHVSFIKYIGKLYRYPAGKFITPLLVETITFYSYITTIVIPFMFNP